MHHQQQHILERLYRLDISLRRLIRALATAPWLRTFKHERVVGRGDDGENVTSLLTKRLVGCAVELVVR